LLPLSVNSRHGWTGWWIRREFFPSGNYPASALVTISHLAFPGMVVEIKGAAVIGDECSATARCSK
jgi:hypothetical protein